MHVYSRVAGEQQRGTTDPDNTQFPHHRQSRPARETENEKDKHSVELLCRKSHHSKLILSFNVNIFSL